MIESVTIETSTVCNSRCIICPQHYKPRAYYMMPLSIFKQILEKFPRLKGVVLCGMYEPLTDPRLPEILEAIHYVQPQAEVTIFTNGSLLNQNIRKILLTHSNVKNIIISIHGYTKEVYEAIMIGLKRDQVYSNVLRLMQEIGTNPEPRVSVSFVRIKQNIHELEAFRNFWKDKVDVVSDFEIMNWCGAAPVDNLLYEEPKHTRPCPMFEQPLVIDAYGNVVRCCYDFSFSYGHVLFGGLEKWLNKKRESATYPTNECIPCLGYRHY